jgi:hypothetical protein
MPTEVDGRLMVRTQDGEGHTFMGPNGWTYNGDLLISLRRSDQLGRPPTSPAMQALVSSASIALSHGSPIERADNSTDGRPHDIFLFDNQESRWLHFLQSS